MKLSVTGKIAKLDFESRNTNPVNVSVLDENGKQIFYDSQQQGGQYSKEIKLDKKGTYFLTIIQDKKSTTEKIIVE